MGLTLKIWDSCQDYVRNECWVLPWKVLDTCKLLVLYLHFLPWGAENHGSMMRGVRGQTLYHRWKPPWLWNTLGIRFKMKSCHFYYSYALITLKANNSHKQNLTHSTSFLSLRWHNTTNLVIVKQQKGTLSQFRGQKSELKVLEGPPIHWEPWGGGRGGLKGEVGRGGGYFLGSSSFWWPLVFLGLWQPNSNLYFCLHLAFFSVPLCPLLF